MASEPQTTPDGERAVHLVDDRILRIFERNAQREKVLMAFVLGIVVGTIYGVLIATFGVHR